MPRGGPLVIPGPFHFENLTMYVFICRSPELESIRALAPPGLKWRNPLFPRGSVLVLIIDYPKAWARDLPSDIYSYREACIFIPCLHLKTGPAYYCPFIYLDGVRPLAAGREIYGFPKKPAKLAIRKLKKGGRATVSVDKNTIIQASWGIGRESSLPEVVKGILDVTLGFGLVKEALERSSLIVGKYLPKVVPFMRIPVINWRRIPAVHSTVYRPAWSVNELTVASFRVDRILGMRLLDVKSDAIKFKGTPADPLNIFGPLETLTAFRAELNFTLPPGKVIRQYHGR